MTEVLRSEGTPLPRGVRTDMERRLGHHFGDVRVHTDSRAAESARAVEARAYTVGKHMVFAAREFAPSTPRGRTLLAHELVHTMQGSAGSRGRAGGMKISDPTDAGELEAEQRARAVTQATPARTCALAVSPDEEGGVEEEATEPSRGTPRQPRQGAATIVCDGSGGYRVSLGSWAGATCGIEGCVRRHEESHASDWRRRWPEGCKGKADGATIPLGGTGYDAFLKTSECTAYGVEESCITPLFNAAVRGKTACEGTLRTHLADTRRQKASFC